MKAATPLLVAALFLGACTHSGEVYDRSKHSEEEFSNGRTAVAVVGTLAAVAAVVAIAADGGGGGYYPTNDYSYAWDYQPRNGQWVCRGRQTGQYANTSNCAYAPVNDYTWPG